MSMMLMLLLLLLLLLLKMMMVMMMMVVMPRVRHPRGLEISGGQKRQLPEAKTPCGGVG